MEYARTLWELIERRVDATPDALMAVDDDMCTLTFAEYWSEAERAAAGLAAGGVRAGDVVSWQLPTWIESLVLVAAVARIGAVQNPLLPTTSVAELSERTDLAGTSLLVTPSYWNGMDHEQTATEVARRAGQMSLLVADRALPQGDPTSLAPLADPLDLAARADGAARLEGGEWLFLTTGADGEPVGVRHSDATLLAATRVMVQRLGLIRHDRHALVAPLSQPGGMLWLFASLVAGCSNILIDRFDPERSIDVLSRENVTLAGADSSFHQGYLERQRREIQPIFPDVRAFCGEGPTRPELVADVRSAFDVPVLSGYGTVEAPLLTLGAITDTDDELARSDGRPTHGVELRLTRPDGSVADPGEVGEIRARAPQLMVGYANPGRSAASFDDDGFFCTGDWGRVDSSGHLVLGGSVSDLIVCNGEHVDASELEQLLHLHHDVFDVAVIGLADADAGQRVCAVVQLADGARQMTLDVTIEHLRDLGVSGAGLPERVEVVDSLPRNAAGAVLKQLLRDEFKG